MPHYATGLPLASRCVTVVAMKALGKLLQLAGLTIPPLSIIAQLTEAISLGQMLTFLVAAVAAFGIGRILEGYAAA